APRRRKRRRRSPPWPPSRSASGTSVPDSSNACSRWPCKAAMSSSSSWRPPRSAPLARSPAPSSRSGVSTGAICRAGYRRFGLLQEEVDQVRLGGLIPELAHQRHHLAPVVGRVVDHVEDRLPQRADHGLPLIRPDDLSLELLLRQRSQQEL